MGNYRKVTGSYGKLREVTGNHGKLQDITGNYGVPPGGTFLNPTRYQAILPLPYVPLCSSLCKNLEYTHFDLKQSSIFVGGCRGCLIIRGGVGIHAKLLYWGRGEVIINGGGGKSRG